jgi:hypothetical protein
MSLVANASLSSFEYGLSSSSFWAPSAPAYEIFRRFRTGLSELRVELADPGHLNAFLRLSVEL